MHRADIRLSHIPGGSGISRIRRAFSVLDKPLLETVVQHLSRLLYNRRPILFSLYQDLLQGKRTEVDFINGHFVHLAHSHGMQAPHNELVVQAVHELEKRKHERFFTREQVIERFRTQNSLSEQSVA